MLGWGVPISILANISNGTFSLFFPPFSNHSYWWKKPTTVDRVSWVDNRVMVENRRISAPGSPWIWSRRASIPCASPRASRKPARSETKGCGWEKLCCVCVFCSMRWFKIFFPYSILLCLLLDINHWYYYDSITYYNCLSLYVIVVCFYFLFCGDCVPHFLESESLQQKRSLWRKWRRLQKSSTSKQMHLGRLSHQHELLKDWKIKHATKILLFRCILRCKKSFHLKVCLCLFTFLPCFTFLGAQDRAALRKAASTALGSKVGWEYTNKKYVFISGEMMWFLSWCHP